jgi:hypothetical protein
MDIRRWMAAMDVVARPAFIFRNTMDEALDGFFARHARSPEFSKSARAKRRRYRPRLHPTKGYRGAHKLFRGGSR